MTQGYYDLITRVSPVFSRPTRITTEHEREFGSKLMAWGIVSTITGVIFMYGGRKQYKKKKHKKLSHQKNVTSYADRSH